MKGLPHSLVVLASVLLCNLIVSSSVGVVRANEEVFRMFFRYGFDQGQIGDPDGEPSENDIKALICATNDFLTESLQNYTKKDTVEVKAVEIDWGFDDWIYNGSEPEAPRNVPVIVNFTTQVYDTEGGTPPTNQELWEATKYFDYFGYIMNYLWTIPQPNFFTDTRGLWYEPFIQPPVTGKMAQNDQCPAPEESEMPGRGPGGNFTLTSIAPSTAPSMAPSMKPTLNRATTLSPTIVPTNTPTTAPISRATTLPPVGRLTSLAPTTKEEEMVYFTIQIDFFANKEREPTDEEVEAMMCQTQKFFEKTLKDQLGQDTTVQVTNIHWDYDTKAALPSMVEFFADVRKPDGTHVPAEEVFKVMEGVDVKAFVEEYVWMSEVYKENIYYETEDIFFAGSYTGSPNPPDPHPGKIQTVRCAS